jgi:hypothetical protein
MPNDIGNGSGTGDAANLHAENAGNNATADANKTKDAAINSTRSIINNFIANIFGFTKKLPKPEFSPGEAKRKRGLGNKDYISYNMPWILYFYPDPTTDPNYVLLDPENDKILLNKTKTQILSVITLMVFLGILYSFWQAGALFPAIHTAWFYFWRYINLTIFFLCFMIVIAIMKGFPFFLKKIRHYAELTINPYKDKKAYRICHKYTVNFRWFFYGGYTIAFALATILWTFLFICILVPLFAIFATICGLLLGDLNTKFVPFGMAEYEVTELGKASMQKRIENASGITKVKEGLSTVKEGLSSAKNSISSGMSYIEGKTDIGKAFKSVTGTPFLKYKVPEVNLPEVKIPDIKLPEVKIPSSIPKII